MNLSGFQYVNYIDEYLDKVLNYYSIYSPHFFVNYYKFKYNESVIDDIKDTRTASYHMADDLSGRQWDKILMLPVWFSSGHGEIMNTDSDFSLQNNVEFSVVIPDMLGMMPLQEDFIEFIIGVNIDSENDPPNEQPLFIVKGYNVSHLGKRRWFQLNLKNFYVSREQLENKTVAKYFYIHQLRQIYDIETAQNILSIYKNLEQDIDFLTSKNNNLYIFNQSPLIGVK